MKNSPIKSYITSALLLLLRNKRYDSITITDITDKAGVSRMSYYRYYTNKDDILLDLIRSLHQELITKFALTNRTRRDFLVLFFQSFKNNPEPFKAIPTDKLSQLFLNNDRTDIGEEFIELLTFNGQKPSKYVVVAAGGALIAVASLWSNNGYKESCEQLADSILREKLVN